MKSVKINLHGFKKDLIQAKWWQAKIALKSRKFKLKYTKHAN